MNSISGNTGKCLAHLARAIKGRDFYEKRKIIAVFADVKDSTVHGWFSANQMPAGEPLIRLRFYLEFLGYDVEELCALHQTVRDAGRLYAFGIAPLSEVADLVGYSGGNANDSLVKVFRGARNVPQERLQQFASFVELYEKQLDEKQRNTINVLVGTSDNHRSEKVSVPVRSRPRTIGESHAALIETLAASVKAMLPLAEYALSNSFTAEERQHVRDLADGNGVSRLSLLLTKLSGEAARSALTKQQ